MKKSLLINVLLLINYPSFGEYYLSFGSGINTINPINIVDNDLKGKVKLTQVFPMVEIAIGNHLQDFKTELAFDYHFMFNSKENIRNDSYGIETNVKTRINALFLNVYKDIYELNDESSLYAGAGAGISFKKEAAKGSLVMNDRTYTLTPLAIKRSNKFAYKLTVGLSKKISKTVAFDVSYNYFDLGFNRAKASKSNQVVIHSKKHNIHNVTLRLRYEL